VAYGFQKLLIHATNVAFSDTVEAAPLPGALSSGNGVRVPVVAEFARVHDAVASERTPEDVRRTGGIKWRRPDDRRVAIDRHREAKEVIRRAV
jgi:hypothetical protein